MGSRERLWAKYGAAWGWPPATMTPEQDREDLAHHAEEIAARITFNYAVLDADETELLGCVYIDPPDERTPGADAVSSWWVVDREAGGPLERALNELVPGWLAETWGFRAVAFSPSSTPGARPCGTSGRGNRGPSRPAGRCRRRRSAGPADS